MKITVAKLIGIGTLIAMLWAGIQGTLYTLSQIKILYADYVDDKIDTWETRLQNTNDEISDRSERIFAYDEKAEDTKLESHEKSRKRRLIAERENFYERKEKQETQLEKWESKAE